MSPSPKFEPQPAREEVQSELGRYFAGGLHHGRLDVPLVLMPGYERVCQYIIA